MQQILFMGATPRLPARKTIISFTKPQREPPEADINAVLSSNQRIAGSGYELSVPKCELSVESSVKI